MVGREGVAEGDDGGEGIGKSMGGGKGVIAVATRLSIISMHIKFCFQQDPLQITSSTL